MTLGMIEVIALVLSFIAISPLIFRLSRALTFKFLSMVLPYKVEVIYKSTDGREFKDFVDSSKLSKYLTELKKIEERKKGAADGKAV